MNKHIEIDEPVVLIRISQLFNSSMTEEELYEATRGVWKMGDRRENAKYAFSVADGTIHEVYKIESWLPAGTLKYNTRPRHDIEIAGRWEFSGKKADNDLQSKYIGKSIKHYFPRGASYPVTYVNC